MEILTFEFPKLFYSFGEKLFDIQIYQFKKKKHGQDTFIYRKNYILYKDIIIYIKKNEVVFMIFFLF